MVLVAALGNMSRRNYEEKIKFHRWSNIEYDDLDRIGDNLYCNLKDMV